MTAIKNAPKAKSRRVESTETADSIQVKLQTIRDEMRSALIERDTEVDLAIAALLAEQHLLLIGPPGVGKSLLLTGLMRRLTGAGNKTFTYLITKHTTPDELFGPVSPKGLIDDRFYRITENRLPEATAGFLDEPFKGSSAILNNLLTILNEREFDNDGKRVKCPLRLCVAASNEWPQGEELGAFFDRFVIRKTVKPVRSRAGIDRLLTDSFEPWAGATLDAADLDAAIAAVAAMPIPTATLAKMVEMIETLSAQGIDVMSASRRVRLGKRIVQAAAWLNGHSEVEVTDLEILGHVWWIVPEQADKAIETVAKIANPSGAAIVALLNECDDVVGATAGKPAAACIEAIAKLKAIAKGDSTGRPNLATLDQSNPKVIAAIAHVKAQITRLNERVVGLD